MLTAETNEAGVEIRGRVVSIRRFSTHDGPGIRTTLFLKGCSLHCAWCHNPETISPAPELAIHPRCTACGACAAVCACHRITPEGKHEFDRANCRACGRCVAVCPNKALTLYGEQRTPEELLPELLADRRFYRESGGGVTVSGGEPLLQSAFCAALFRELKREGIHCAVDTCGNVPFRAVEEVLPYTDLFLYDLKQMDDALHRRWTGASNRLILENLRRISAAGKEFEIRIPVVPGVNDTEEMFQAAAAFLRDLPGLRAVKLLPYHDFARSKYTAVGRCDTMPHAAPPPQDQLAQWGELFRSFTRC